MSAIFISHSSKDNAATAQLRKWLEEDGHRSVFLDFDPEVGIPPGTEWEKELYRQLRTCRAVIVVCSEHSMASKWCFVEITHAKALGKDIIPVKVAECKIDSVLTSRQVFDLTTNPATGRDELRRGLKALGVDASDSFDWDGSRPPYPGFLSFQEEDAAIFFGRAAEIQQGLELLNRLRQFGGSRIVGVLGPSGSGKSSLVRAGLLPRLRCDADRWVIIDPFRPQGRPIGEFAIVLGKAFKRYGQDHDWKTLRTQLQTSAGADGSQGDALNQFAREIQIAAGKPEAKVLIVIDQTEEILIDPKNDESNCFLASLHDALEADDSPLMVLFTLRSDFLGSFQTHAVASALTFEDLRVEQMSVSGLLQVIEGPASRAGLELEPGLSQELVNDTRTNDAMPLLAFTLRELYERYGDDDLLTVKEYREDLGGITKSVARAADAVFSAKPLSDDQRIELRHALISMVQINDQRQYTRRTIDWGQVPVGIQEVLERFVKARLLVSRIDETDQTKGVLEVAHEALFSSWSILKKWIDDDFSTLLILAELRRAAQDWVKAEESDRSSFLWRGLRLERALELRSGKGIILAVTELGFLKASKRQRDRSRRWRAAGVLSLVAMLIGVSIWALSIYAKSLERGSRSEDIELLLKLESESREVAQGVWPHFDGETDIAALKPEATAAVDAAKDWLDRAEKLKRKHGHYEGALRKLLEFGNPKTESNASDNVVTHDFQNAQDQVDYQEIRQLVLATLALQTERSLDTPQYFTSPSLPNARIPSRFQRLRWACGLLKEFVDHKPKWEEAINSIRSNVYVADDGTRQPLRYVGAELSDLKPQVGLIPDRPNQQGYYEFRHVLSPNSLIGVDRPTPQKARSHADGAGEKRTVEQQDVKLGPLFNKMEVRLVLLPGGEFIMGSNNSDEPEEYPHKVLLSPFYIAKYELSRDQWENTGKAPSHGEFSNFPADKMDWHEARRFCAESGLSLPTEAQWEYACKAGAGPEQPFSFGEHLTAEVANYGNPGGGPIPVTSCKPNAYGLHNLHGNAWEWCEDGYEKDFYFEPEANGPDPVCSKDPTLRVIRGGAHDVLEAICRSACREFQDANSRSDAVGLRPARSLTIKRLYVNEK